MFGCCRRQGYEVRTYSFEYPQECVGSLTDAQIKALIDKMAASSLRAARFQIGAFTMCASLSGQKLTIKPPSWWCRAKRIDLVFQLQTVATRRDPEVWGLFDFSTGRGRLIPNNNFLLTGTDSSPRNLPDSTSRQMNRNDQNNESSEG